MRPRPLKTGVVLASLSTARRTLLAGAGVAFEAVAPGVDEDAVKARMADATPKAVAEALAAAKALAPTRPGALVIGCDQTLELEGRLYDKAPELTAARARLLALRGRTHQLHAAAAVARDGEVIWRTTATAILTMRDFSEAFLDGYLATEGPTALGSVGCYRLEGPGAQLFDRIDGDYFAILGLPLMELLDLLRREGTLTT